MLCVLTMTNVDFVLNKVKEIKAYLTDRRQKYICGAETHLTLLTIYRI